MIRRHVLVLAVALSSAVGSGCGGNDTDPSDPQASFTWTTGGRSYSATGTSMDGDGSFRSLNGITCNPFGGVTLTLLEPLAVGQVPASQIYSLQYFEPNTQWDSNSQKTVTLTAVTPRIIGTFQFTGTQLNNASNVITVQGQFNMDYQSRKVCPG